MEKTIYVIGHKNPDTDAVVAAKAYAEKNAGWPARSEACDNKS